MIHCHKKIIEIYFIYNFLFVILHPISENPMHLMMFTPSQRRAASERCNHKTFKTKKFNVFRSS